MAWLDYERHDGKRCRLFKATLARTLGDYYQAMFEADEKTDDPHSPYLLIQRQFEDPDDHLCYVETHDEKYIGHFFLHRVEFTLHGLSIELDRPNDNLLNVTFTMAPSDF